MKGETLIFVLAIVIIGLIIVKNLAPKLENFGSENVIEENQVSIENSAEEKNVMKEEQNIIEDTDMSVNNQNVIDVSGIQELKNQLN